MSVLITGINGFVGRNIAKRLIENNFEIIGTSTKDRPVVSGLKKYVKSSLGESNFIDPFVEIAQLDAIVHVAASLSHNNDDTDLIKTNCLGVMQICELAKKTQCKKIIYISSIPVIGKPEVLPITELHSVTPPTVYHATKIFGEYVLDLLKNEGVNVIHLRLPSPIGSDMPSGKIFSVFVDKCLKNEDISLLGKGGRVQNYIDVQDVASAVQLCLKQNNINGVFNIASDKSLSNFELAQICRNVLSSTSNITFNGKDDPEENVRWDISIKKANELLGFVPSKRIEETILERKKYCENINN